MLWQIGIYVATIATKINPFRNLGGESKLKSMVVLKSLKETTFVLAVEHSEKRTPWFII